MNQRISSATRKALSLALDAGLILATPGAETWAAAARSAESGRASLVPALATPVAPGAKPANQRGLGTTGQAAAASVPAKRQEGLPASSEMDQKALAETAERSAPAPAPAAEPVKAIDSLIGLGRTAVAHPENVETSEGRTYDASAEMPPGDELLIPVRTIEGRLQPGNAIPVLAVPQAFKALRARLEMSQEDHVKVVRKKAAATGLLTIAAQALACRFQDVSWISTALAAIPPAFVVLYLIHEARARPTASTEPPKAEERQSPGSITSGGHAKPIIACLVAAIFAALLLPSLAATLAQFGPGLGLASGLAASAKAVTYGLPLSFSAATALKFFFPETPSESGGGWTLREYVLRSFSDVAPEETLYRWGIFGGLLWWSKLALPSPLLAFFPAAAASSYLFLRKHPQSTDPMRAVMISSLGMLCAYAYFATGSLLWPMAIHLLNNLILLAVAIVGRILLASRPPWQSGSRRA